MVKKTTFTNLADLEKYIQIQFANNVWKNQGIKDVIAEEMSQAVFDVVYAAYDPKVYQRRMDDGGLSDVRNVEITYIEPVVNGISVIVENLTEGSNYALYGHETDSMNSHLITDTIEEGSDNQHTSPKNKEKGWYDPSGEWAEPRPFIETTIDRLKANPTRLTDEVKQSLKSIGLNIK